MDEPWLRGPIRGLSPLLAPVFFCFQQAREDLERHTTGLTSNEVWFRGPESASVGFHLRHIAGSTDRLVTYLRGAELSAAQMEALRMEQSEAGPDLHDLLAEMDRTFGEAEQVVRGIDVATLAQPRTVGRKRLPTTVIGLLTHLAEHTQRHVGLAIAAARVARANRT